MHQLVYIVQINIFIILVEKTDSMYVSSKSKMKVQINNFLGVNLIHLSSSHTVHNHQNKG